MKLALISDIHGNLPALESVLEDIHLQEVDEIIFLGDLATIGPQPKEVIEKIIALNCSCIMGNHDAALLDMDNLEKYHIAPPLHSSLLWCLNQLNGDDLNFIYSFKPVIKKTLSWEIQLFCYHGSPESNTDIILSSTEDSIFKNISSQNSAHIFVGGHTHLQMNKKYKDKLFINSGSVGSAFPRFFKPGELPMLLPVAQYAIINIEGEKIEVILKQVKFDTQSLKDIILNSDIPIKDWWLAQYE